MAFLPERTFLEENLATNYDLSNGITGFTSSDLSKYLTFSVHFVYSSVAGSNIFVLEQSNDNTNWSNLSEEYELPVGSGNFIIDKGTFSGKYVRANFSSSASGNVSIVLLAKR
jgi:hypothetical protein